MQAVEGFLSPDPEGRTRAFERVWPAQSGAATLPRRSLWKGRGIWYAAVAIVVLLAIALVALKTPSPVSGPLESTQITSSAEPKEGPLFTDGSRLYFDSRGTPSEMAVSGGSIVPMRILERGTLLLDISADASKALGLKPDGEDTLGRGTLWTTAMLGGTPQKLSDHLVNDARWSPDGRSVVFFDLRTLYRIGADGENLTRIWQAPKDVDDLAFSPDGRQLSVTVDTFLPTLRGCGVWAPTGRTHSHCGSIGLPMSNSLPASGRRTGATSCFRPIAKGAPMYTSSLRRVGLNSGRSRRQ